MSKICIVGDSWGTQRGWHPDLQKTNRHTMGWLKKLKGHKVKNFSIPGGTNGNTIHKATQYYRTHPSMMPKYIIWFHTESLRDRESGFFRRKYKIMDLTREKAQDNYKKFNALLKLTGAKDLIIGGQAPVITELLEHEPYFLIEDWRSEILGVPSVMTHSLVHHDLFENENCLDDAETRTKMLEENIRIVDQCKDSIYFPDNAHPGGKAHYLLSQRLINYIE